MNTTAKLHLPVVILVLLLGCSGEPADQGQARKAPEPAPMTPPESEIPHWMSAELADWVRTDRPGLYEKLGKDAEALRRLDSLWPKEEAAVPPALEWFRTDLDLLR